jgi:hypothetical protein
MKIRFSTMTRRYFTFAEGGKAPFPRDQSSAEPSCDRGIRVEFSPPAKSQKRR